MCSMFSAFNGFKDLKLFGRDPFKLMVLVLFWGLALWRAKLGKQLWDIMAARGLQCYTSRFYNRCWGSNRWGWTQGQKPTRPCKYVGNLPAIPLLYIVFTRCSVKSFQMIHLPKILEWVSMQPWRCGEHEPVTHNTRPNLTRLVGMHAMSPKWFNFYGFKSEEVLISQSGKFGCLPKAHTYVCVCWVYHRSAILYKPESWAYCLQK